MYSIIRSNRLSTLAMIELPTILSADIIAEYFYKFGSFTLEAICFLITWGLFSFLFTRMESAFRKKTKK